MLDMLLASHGEVAARRLRDRREMIRAWARLRARQVDKGVLAMRMGHRDSLALPPGVLIEGE
jgi:hypothetical protein